ncbi:hypothetical protein Tco_1005443 [Tanacetum coccineum]|uniref:Uncharacterized protein n=1 Tax=Tanacetum coccineum TaxID=301880 RepID=A0ABQ5FF07_9ASTR
MVVVLKFMGEGYIMRTIHVEYKWTLPRYSITKVFGHVLNESPKKSISNVLKNLKNPRQVVKGVQNDDDLDTNGRNSKLAEEGVNSGVVSSTHGSSPVAPKLMLVNDDGKPLNKVDPVNADSNSDVEVAYDETAQFMAIGGANDASLYEDEDNDIYDTYDIKGLSKQELTLYERV